MDAFDDNIQGIDNIDSKYRARNHEVAVQYLTTALSAAREKALLKQHKDKLSISERKLSKAQTINNNLYMNRNDLLKLLQKKE